MSESLVSVVIPTYGRPNSLKRCIDSVLNQTYPYLEIIIVDDNDPHTQFRAETELVMQAYVESHKVKYFQHERNMNGSAARNTGWRNASGDFITFIDDDDEIFATKIEKQVQCLESLDSSWGACYTGYEITGTNGYKQISRENRQGNCYCDALMRTFYMGSGSNLLLRKKVVDEVHGYDESFRRNQDIEFLARVTEKYKVAYVDEVLLNIHQDETRAKITFEFSNEVTDYYLKKFESRINSLAPKDKERVLAVISLERSRVALIYHKYVTAFKILRKDKVKIRYVFRYLKYLLARRITHTSYGFSG